MSLELEKSDVADLEFVTVRAALRHGEDLLSRFGVASPRLDAEVLLGHALNCCREDLYRGLEGVLTQEVRDRFVALLGRRRRGEPVAYITGEREFWSLAFFVTPQVLVPRPETELLVEVALRIPARQVSLARILEIGTGSGAIAVSLATERADAQIWATDLSAAALEVARVNARRHRVEKQIHFLQGDLFAPLREWDLGLFDLMISNPPYVLSGEIEHLASEIRHWEPRLALDGGVDGLDFYRRILGDAHRYLSGAGFLVLEIGGDSGTQVSRLVEAAGTFRAPAIYRDYAGRERVVVAQKHPSDTIY